VATASAWSQPHPPDSTASGQPFATSASNASRLVAPLALVQPPAPAVGAQPAERLEQRDWIARGLAVAGIFVTLAKWWYDRSAKQRDVRRSVEDDFWFRKIVAPAAIEPLVVVLTKTLASLPDASTPEQTQKHFAIEMTTDFQQIYAKLPLLAFLDAELANNVAEAVRRCEDLLTDHVSALGASIAPSATTASDSWAAMNEALGLIKTHQLGRVTR